MHILDHWRPPPARLQPWTTRTTSGFNTHGELQLKQTNTEEQTYCLLECAACKLSSQSTPRTKRRPQPRAVLARPSGPQTSAALRPVRNSV